MAFNPPNRVPPRAPSTPEYLLILGMYFNIVPIPNDDAKVSTAPLMYTSIAPSENCTILFSPQ